MGRARIFVITVRENNWCFLHINLDVWSGFWFNQSLLEIKLPNRVCQENAWRANQEREKHNGGSDDQSCLKIYWNQRNKKKKELQRCFASDLFWFRLNDSKFWLSKPPVPYFFARLVLMRHRPQRGDPTSSHTRQFPSVSFWHTEHHLSELHFPPATASIQNQHCYLGGNRSLPHSEGNGVWFDFLFSRCCCSC